MTMDKPHYISTGEPQLPRLTDAHSRNEHLKELCTRSEGLLELVDIGESEQDRPIVAVEVGNGPLHASILSGSHADEPVGSETILALLRRIVSNRSRYERLLADWTLSLLPHINPDGEAANARWIAQWPDIAAYLRYAVRELPGRDVEFGYPDMRRENRQVSDYLETRGPINLHVSFHGMGFGEGVLLLIEREWRERTVDLQKQYTEAVMAKGLRLHDHDRKGEKGFEYMGPGFTSTPRGAAMRAYFEERDDPETAGLFKMSSMEFIRMLGGDPLSLVTEVPLFLVTGGPIPSVPGSPASYLSLREKLRSSDAAVTDDDWISSLVETYGLQPVDLGTQIALQLEALSLGLQTAAGGCRS